MKQKTKLKKTSELPIEPSAEGVVKLLLKDHKAMRILMKKIRSHRADYAQASENFYLLEKLVRSHVKAEEYSLLDRIRENPKFDGHANESKEEHHIHEGILQGIAKLSDKKRKSTQMKIFCEMLEDHIDEEEEELFPAFKKYSALKTRKKMGALFLKKRTETRRKPEHLGSMKND